MKILTFSSLYPNNVDPAYGVFVERRLCELTKKSAIESTVIAPVPWFPFQSKLFGKYAKMAAIEKTSTRYDIPVFYPRYLNIPKIGMRLAPWLMASAAVPFARKIMRTSGPWTLVDAHYFYPDGVAASILARKLNIPYIITARGSDINVLAEFRRPRKLILRAAEHACAIVAVSRALATKMIDLGIDAGKIHVCRNGVDLEFFCPGSKVRAREELRMTGTVFLSAGSLVPEKGHEIVIRFVAELANANLVVAGDGPDLRRLKSIVQELRIDDRVTFVGKVDAISLRRYYRAADAFVLMSEREGMPNVLLESIACGTPVLASDVGGIPEILTSDAAGCLVTERSAAGLRHSWESFSRRGIDKQQVRQCAEKFSWQETIARLNSLMMSCAAKHKGGYEFMDL